MNRLLLIILMLVQAQLTFAQASLLENCTISKNEEAYQISTPKINDCVVLTFANNKKTGKHYNVNVSAYGKTANKKAQNVNIKLANGTVIARKMKVKYTAEKSGKHLYSASLNLTKEELDLMKKFKVSFIQIDACIVMFDEKKGVMLKDYVTILDKEMNK